MSLVKKTTTSVEVYKVAGDSMEMAFHNLKTTKKLDYHSLEAETSVSLNKDSITNGAIYKHSKELHRLYTNNRISELTVRGCLYNHKPIIKDPNRILVHNIVNRGTKQWETVNSFRFESGEVIEELVCSKEEATNRAKELALNFNKTVTVVVSKRLVGSDGIQVIAEFIPFTNVDDSNIYVFWVYTTKTEQVEEDDLIEANTEVDTNGQLCIFEDLYSYRGREIINKLVDDEL
jgi:hypothetical protein